LFFNLEILVLVLVNTAHFLYADRIMDLVCVTAVYDHGCRTFRCSSWAFLSYISAYMSAYILYLNICNSFVRVTTCLENRKMSGISLKIRELSGGKCCQGTVA